MLSFSNGTLYLRKIEVPEMPTNILSDIQASYANYVENTSKEDVEYLESLLREIKSCENIRLVPQEYAVREYTSYDDGMVRNVRCIPVTVNVYREESGKRTKIRSNWEIFKIPTMRDFGKFNVNGNLKSVVMQLRSSYDVSYDKAIGTLNISMPRANIRLKASEKSIYIKSPKSKQGLYNIMLYMLRTAGDNTPITDYIKNARILNALGYEEYRIEDVLLQEVKAHQIGTINLYASEQYKLGTCRESLNDALSLERGIGYELAEPILNYPEGYIVDDKFIMDMYRNRLVTYVIKTREYPNKYVYRGQNVLLTEIPAGFKNCAKLRSLLPEYAESVTIPTDVKLTEEQVLQLMYTDGRDMTSQDFEFLDNLGMRQVLIAINKTTKPFLFSMYREITGNYMAPLYKLTDSTPDGRDADEWVYYFNNPNLDKCCPENITGHDFVALCSLIGEIFSTGTCKLMNRDTAFLKRIIMCGDIFSETLRMTMRNFVSQRKDHIARMITSSIVDPNGGDNPFISLSKEWYSYMVKEKYLATVDSINLSAEIAQACRVNTQVTNSQAIPDEQRHLAIQYFGRICPFTTPAGQKLGLVNSRAMGSRVRDGLLETAYHKVLASGDGIRVSKDIVWLTAKEELGHKFGDILSLKKDSNGKYLNTKILARVPNPDDGEDPFIFKNINAFELINGYVNVYPEQFISPTVNLVPFACSDNPVRLSFGASQIQQSINMVDSEKPLVVTPMYAEMFNFASNNQYIAEKAGVITSIDGVGITIKSDIDDSEYQIITKDRMMSTNKYRVIDYHYKVGQHVKKNDIVAEGYVYPQDFVVRSPYNGFVSEIDHDHITLSKSNNMDAVDLEESQVCRIPLNSFRQLGNNAIFLNLHVSVGDSVVKGQILADTCTSRDGVFSPSRNPLVCYWPNGYTYEDGVCATERATIKYISFLSTKTMHRMRLSTFKRAALRSPSGFSYKEAGQKITDVMKFKTHADMQADRFENIMATHKSHGIFYAYRQYTDSQKEVTDFTLNMLSMNKLKSGDKMSGRHGNKGVVSSKVYKDSEALQLSNGMTVEFILGPCGIPSRMNLGQIWEIHLSLVAKVLSIRADSPAFNGGSPEEVSMLMKYAYAVANNVPDEPENRKAAFDAIAGAFKDIPRSMHEWVWEHIENALDWKGVFDEKGCAKVYDPETETWLDGDIIIGFPMFNKLVQEADEKLNVRSGPMEEAYSRTTSQPIDNITSAKGQRMAEMELVALAATGCSSFIDEILNEKSDNEGRRTNALLKQLGEKDARYYAEPNQCSSRAVDNLLFLLEGCGVKLDVPTEVTDIGYTNSIQRSSLNLERYLKNRFSTQYAPKEAEEKVSDFDGVAGQ